MALMHLDNIQVVARLRPLNQARVSELVESIRSLGLLNPITVTDAGVLVAGYHRLEACRQLAAEDEAWSIVPVSYFELEDQRQRAEIAENLFRNELSVLERAEQLMLYLGEAARLPAEEQARALGMSRKTFFNYRRIAREIAAPLRTRIKALDGELQHSTRQLLELAALPPAQQAARIEALEARNAVPAESPPAKSRKTLTLTLPGELQGRLRQRAGDLGLNQSEFTRRLLEQALNAFEKGELALED